MPDFSNYVRSPFLWFKSTNKKLWCWCLPTVPKPRRDGDCEWGLLSQLWFHSKWRENQITNCQLFLQGTELCTSRSFSSFSSHHNLEIAVSYPIIFSVKCNLSQLLLQCIITRAGRLWTPRYKSVGPIHAGNASTLNVCVCAKCVLSCLSHVRLFVPLQTVAHQAPLSRGFSRQEYWNRLPWPPPGDLPGTGIKPESPTSPALADRFFTTSATQEALKNTLLNFQH